MPFEFEQERAGPRVPYPRRRVVTAGEDPGPVGGERHAPHPACRSFEIEQERTRVRVPDLDLAMRGSSSSARIEIASAREYPHAIRAE